MVAAGLSDPRDVQVAKGYLTDLEKLARFELAIVDVPSEKQRNHRLEREAVLGAMLRQSFPVSHNPAFLDLLTDLDTFDTPPKAKA